MDVGLNMVTKEQVCVKEVSSSGLGCDGLGNKGQFSHGSTKGKPNSNSVNANQNGGFKFGADQHGQRGYGEFESVDNGVGSLPHSHHDSVQANASVGMDDYRAGLVKNGRDEDDREKNGGG
nr:hypothetical protein CFP56_18679 [Quercus suber]